MKGNLVKMTKLYFPNSNLPFSSVKSNLRKYFKFFKLLITLEATL